MNCLTKSKLGLLLLIFVSASPAVAAEPKTTSVEHASANGVSFDYPKELTLTTTPDDAGTKLYLKTGDAPPLILVLVYSIGISPSEIMEINARNFREGWAKLNWKYTETPTSQLFNGERYTGKEFKVINRNDIEVDHRIFTLSVNRHTVFIMAQAGVADSGHMRDLLRVVTSSIH